MIQAYNITFLWFKITCSQENRIWHWEFAYVAKLVRKETLESNVFAYMLGYLDSFHPETHV